MHIVIVKRCKKFAYLSDKTVRIIFLMIWKFIKLVCLYLLNHILQDIKSLYIYKNFNMVVSRNLKGFKRLGKIIWKYI